MLSTEWDEELFIEVMREEGREEGASTREIEIARNMKADGDPVEKIARNTGLSEEAIAAL